MPIKLLHAVDTGTHKWSNMSVKCTVGTATTQLYSFQQTSHRTTNVPSFILNTLGPGETLSSLRLSKQLECKASDKSCVLQFGSIY